MDLKNIKDLTPIFDYFQDAEIEMIAVGASMLTSWQSAALLLAIPSDKMKPVLKAMRNLPKADPFLLEKYEKYLQKQLKQVITSEKIG